MVGTLEAGDFKSLKSEVRLLLVRHAQSANKCRLPRPHSHLEAGRSVCYEAWPSRGSRSRCDHPAMLSQFVSGRRLDGLRTSASECSGASACQRFQALTVTPKRCGFAMHSS